MRAGLLPPPLPCGPPCAPQVMAAQANFVRVKVDGLEGGLAGEAPPRPRLLCVVRALLKKMRREVLVGDRVRVVGIDWADGRGGRPGRVAGPVGLCGWTMHGVCGAGIAYTCMPSIASPAVQRCGPRSPPDSLLCSPGGVLCGAVRCRHG